MDSVDVCAATSTADSGNKRRVHNTDRDWLNRLHLRKAALQTPAMQNTDKHGPKKIAATAEQRTSTTWPPSKKRPNHEELQRTIHSGNTLRFRCSQCTDAIERTPKDLLKHFDEKHKGCPPVFSCHMCKFTTHEFSYLQVHILSHKDTFSCCSLCKDDVQRTWAEFSTHLTKVHTQNGKYVCDVCKKFSTLDDKEFLEHVLIHNLGLDMRNEQGIDKMSSYKCQFCVYEASQKMLLTKHVKALHGSLICNTDVNTFSMGDPKGKPRMTRSTEKDLSWLTQDCISLPGREFLDKYCHLSDTKTTLEETEQFLLKSGKQRWSKALQNVLSNVPQDVNLQSKPEIGIVSVSPDSSQDVLTVKNKINQNGVSFAKRLRLMTEKEVESGDADSCEKILSDTGLQSQQMKLNDVLMNEPSVSPMLEENRENHRLKPHLNDSFNGDEVIQDGVITNELKAEERKAVCKALPKKKRKNMRWKTMKRKSKRADKSQKAPTLKIVLKKNSKMGKQWITQTSQTTQSQRKCTVTKNEMKTSNTVEGTIQDKHRTVDCEPVNTVKKGAERQDGGCLIADSVVTNRTKKKSGDKNEVSADGGASSELKTLPDGSSEASPSPQPVITQHSESAHPSVSPPPSDAQTQDALLTDSSLVPRKTSESPFHFPAGPAPKTLERTLRLVALSPAQRVKRPMGVQPVVVLNHPDADIPEVSRIMEVIKKYKGEICKVVLSKRTLGAISGQGFSHGAQRNTVRERFLLKIKLRRLNKKKYKVVNGGASSVQTKGTQGFRCWFCGRMFINQEVWLSHKQRHLLEWKSPNCESS